MIICGLIPSHQPSPTGEGVRLAGQTKTRPPSGKVKSETISTLVDCDKMAKIRSIATIEGLSIRDVIGVGINMVIKKYEKSHGAILVKKKQKGNIDEIFQ